MIIKKIIQLFLIDVVLYIIKKMFSLQIQLIYIILIKNNIKIKKKECLMNNNKLKKQKMKDQKIKKKRMKMSKMIQMIKMKKMKIKKKK